MDDYLDCFESTERAIKVIHKVTQISWQGFKPTKWPLKVSFFKKLHN